MSHSKGLLPRRHKPGHYKQLPMFRDVFAEQIRAISQDDWPDLIPRANSLRPLVKRWNDQNGIGQCGAESGSQALEIIRVLAGLPDIDLSAASLYCRVNGGRDQGSHLDDTWDELTTRGVLPTPGQGFEHDYEPVGWRNNLPSGWEETSAQFRITEGYEISNHKEAVTAWLLGFPVSSGRDGHAMCEVGYHYDDRQRLIRVDLGSWGMGEVGGAPDYLDGFHTNLVNPASDDRFYEVYGAWAGRVVVANANDLPSPQ